MVFIRTVIGAILGAAVALLIFRFIPFSPDLSDWGGRTFPRSYILPVIIVAIVGYISGWIAANMSRSTGRLCGMLAVIIAGVVAIGWDTGSQVLRPLWHHPAYQVFSDHALLAIAILLVAGHLGGLRVERSAAKATENNQTNP